LAIPKRLILKPSRRFAFLHNRSRLSWLAPIFLCLLFLTGKVAKAQSPAAVAGEPSPLSVGDTFQDMLLENVLFHGEQNLDTKTLAGKAIILDFWATWCGACVSAFPKNEAIAAKHKDKLAIIPVTYESGDKVLKFVSGLREKKGWALAMPFVTDNTDLGKLFPHQSLPHYVWISADRKVAAITSSQQINEENIDGLLAGKNLELEVKSESNIRYDKSGLLIAGNPQYGPKPILFQSVLTGHIENLSSEHILEQPPIPGIHRFVFLNWTLGNLAVSAFGEGDNRKYFGANRLFLEVEDPDKIDPLPENRGDAYKKWSLSNTYCYELIVPDSLASKKYLYLQEDLRRYFPQYRFSVEKRDLEVFKIVRTDGLERYKAEPTQKLHFAFSITGGSIHNIMLNGLVGYLNIYLMQDSPFPVVDCTGIEFPVSLDLEADMTDPLSIAAALRPYGLDMVKARMPLEVLVIRDAPFSTNKQ
jgi:thiol-disulfide isomerase/thioredoxin